MDIPVVGTVYDSSNNICADNIDFGKQVTIQSGNTGQYYVDYKLFWTAFCRKDTYGGSR